MRSLKSPSRLAPALGVAWGLVIVMLVAATLGAAPRSSAAGSAQGNGAQHAGKSALARWRAGAFEEIEDALLL